MYMKQLFAERMFPECGRKSDPNAVRAPAYRHRFRPTGVHTEPFGPCVAGCIGRSVRCSGTRAELSDARGYTKNPVGRARKNFRQCVSEFTIKCRLSSAHELGEGSTET